MFFRKGDPGCFDCTDLNGEWFCTMNCGPAITPKEPDMTNTLDDWKPRKGKTKTDEPMATPMELHRMKMESRREALERERHEAEAADRLWTIFGSLGVDGHGRKAFVAAYHGRHDTEETQDAFESQHVGAIILGPHFIIGDRHEVASEIAKMISVDELTIRWLGVR